MKTYLHMLGIFLTLSMVPFGWCFHEEDMGYPKKIEFPAEGGSETFYGELVNLSYVDRGPGTNDSESVPTVVINRNDTVEVVKFDWLTVDCDAYAKKVTFTADNNTTGRTREIDVQLTSCYEYSITKVVQKANK